MTLGTLRAAGAGLAVLAAIGAGVAGCSVEERPAPSASVNAALQPVAVAVETLGRHDVEDGVEAVGTVRSRAQSTLSPKIVAAVRSVSVREGDRVRAGQTLVVLDDRDVRAQQRRADAALTEAQSARDETGRALAAADRAIEAATAQHELAQATWTRYRRLVDEGLVSVQDYDERSAGAKVAAAEVARTREMRASLLARQQQAEAAIARATAERETAALAVGYAVIAAPTDGLVVGRSVEVGNLAAPGTVLLTLEEEHYRLEATVQESDLARVRVGDTAAVTLDAVGRTLAGRVVEIVPAADPMSRTFLVKVELPPTPGLKSGFYGRARFGARSRAALTVPQSAVTERGQLEAVFVVDGGQTAALRLVKTGKRLGDRVEILSGLADGERVVVRGAERLADGQPVTVGP